MVLPFRDNIQPFFFLNGVVLILQDFLINDTLTLAIGPGHIETLLLCVPKVFFKAGEHVFNSISKIHKHPNGHHLNGGGTQVVLVEEFLDVGPVKEEYGYLLEMELFVGGFVEVVKSVDEHIFVETVGVFVEFGGVGKGGATDFVVDELGGGVQGYEELFFVVDIHVEI